MTRILSSKDICSGLWRGFGSFTDTPNELWESDSWLCSLRTTSRERVNFPNGSPIICSEFVAYNSREHGGDRVGRVYGIGIDQRSNSKKKGEVVIKMQMVYLTAELPAKLKAVGSKLQVPLTRFEKLLLEDGFEFVLVDDLVQRVEFTIDYAFGNGIPGQRDRAFKPKSQIRRVLNLAHEEIRPAAQSHPHIAELELKAYGREWIIEALERSFVSLPFLTFIDGFGLYRNMYISMTGVYITLAA